MGESRPSAGPLRFEHTSVSFEVTVLIWAPVEVAFIADGGLYLKRSGEEARALESKFGEVVIERTRRSEHRHGWKSDTSTGGGMIPRAALWGRQRQPGTEHLRVVFHGLARGEGESAGNLIYSLSVGDVGGIFAYDPKEDREIRLMHRGKGFVLDDLARHPESDALACSVRASDGSANIALVREHPLELTSGDSVDEAPSWVPGPGRRIVYQSSGISRDRAGRPMAFGPSSIQILDSDKGTLTTAAEDPKSDLIHPRMGPDGTLYFIRRPYQGASVPPAFLFTRILLDLILLPFRLVAVLFHFLNLKALIYSGKPLTTAGGPAGGPHADIRQIMLWNRAAEAEQAMQDAAGAEERALVPDSWKLIRKRGGAEEVIASRVLSFDLGKDGGVVYTNGTAIFELDPAGKKTKLCEATRVTRVLALS